MIFSFSVTFHKNTHIHTHMFVSVSACEMLADVKWFLLKLMHKTVFYYYISSPIKHKVKKASFSVIYEMCRHFGDIEANQRCFQNHDAKYFFKVLKWKLIRYKFMYRWKHDTSNVLMDAYCALGQKVGSNNGWRQAKIADTGWHVNTVDVVRYFGVVL